MEKFSKPSKTKKGLDVSLNDLLRKRAAGVEIQHQLKPVFNPGSVLNEVDLEKFRNLDLVDQQQILKSINNTVQRNQVDLIMKKKVKEDEAIWQEFLKKNSESVEPLVEQKAELPPSLKG